MTGWRLGALMALIGAAGALGLAPYGLWPLSLLALLALGWALEGQGTRRAAWIGWSFAAGYFAHGLSWIVEPFLVDVALHGWMIPFALVGMAGGLALFWGLACWLGARLGSVWSIALFLALAELARGYVLTGFPWAALGQIWIDTPLAQSLSVIGPDGLSTLTLLATVPLGAALRARAGLLVAAGMVVPLAALALWPVPDVAMTDRVVRIVQPNAPQHQKWDPAWVPVFYDRHLELSAGAPAPDLVVWSETALPWTLGWSAVPLDEIAAGVGVPVLAGIQRVEDGRAYNSAILISPDAQVDAIYDKHHLVPFGEYMPLPGLFRALGIRALAERATYGFSAGPGPSVIDLPGIGPGLPLICYEAVFPRNLRSATRPAVLVAMTNDAWFGARSGPYQHLVQARMRAIEQGLPMIRAANTGISAMINPAGRVLSQIPLGVSGVIDAALPAPLRVTVYARYGDAPVLIFLILMTSVAIFRQRRAVSH